MIDEQIAREEAADAALLAEENYSITDRSRI